MQRFIKVMTILIIIIIILTQVVYAIDPNYYDPQNSGIKSDNEKIKEVAGKVLGIIQVIGVAVSVIVLMIIGMKYMVGSASEKAEYKKAMIPYIIGMLLLFAATTIPNMVYKVMNPINK